MMRRNPRLERAIVVVFIAIACFVALYDSGGAAFVADAARHAQGRTTRPDVAIVMTDQQRADAFGATSSGDLRTPAMDRLATDGVLFTRAFTATPQCSPSRAALLTGLYPHRTGVMGNTPGDAGERGTATQDAPPAGMSAALDRSLPTLGKLFGAAGYETAYFGKWHLGGTPGDYGFEVHDSTIGDAGLARRVVAFLQTRRANGSRRPLLLIVSWLNPHDIYGVLSAPPPPPHALAAARLPANLTDDLRVKPFPQRHYLDADQGRPFVGAGPDMWRRYRAFYNELVETVDAEIGTVLEALKDAAPLTVFTTDHGDLGGAHGLPYKGPAMYEELVKVPLVISWPGRIRPLRSDALVSLIDVLPTLCDLAGIDGPRAADGVSLRRVLDGSEATPRGRETIFAEYYGKQSWRVPIRMARTTRWKYVRYLGYGEELYDLTTDPGELTNLANDRRSAAQRDDLARKLDDWMKRTRDPFLTLTATDRSGKVVPGDVKQ